MKMNKKQSLLLSKFKEKKYELLFSFMAMVVGIVIGFQLENVRQNISDNNSTKLKLHYMHLDTQYNFDLSTKLLDAYSDPDLLNTYIMFLDEQSTRAVLEDENIFNVLPHYNVSLIRSYLDALLVVNNMHKQYIDYTNLAKYSQIQDIIMYRESLKENIVAFISTLMEIQTQLKEYFDINLYDREKIKESELRIKARKNVLMDEYKIE